MRRDQEQKFFDNSREGYEEEAWDRSKAPNGTTKSLRESVGGNPETRTLYLRDVARRNANPGRKAVVCGP
jgi:hypothetical protein